VLSEPVATSVGGAGVTPLAALGSTLLTAVQALGRELDTVQLTVDPEVSARLAGAKDELAAIHDEMHQQQLEISELLAGVGSSRAAMIRRFLSTIPLATLLTSPTGKIIEANAAAHAAMRMPIGTLTGKPIFAYIAQDDRRHLRSALSASVQGDELRQVTARVTPRHAVAVRSYFALVREADGPGTQVGVDPSRVDPSSVDRSVDAVAEPDDEAVELSGADVDAARAADEESTSGPTVRWVIVPDYESVDGPPSHLQLEALTRLCRLGANDGDLRATLTQVARLCLQAVEEAGAVSLLVGDPLEPTMTVATSATAQHLDGLQHSRAGGPSFDAYRSRRPIALDGEAVTEHHGLADDQQARSVHSLLVVPLMTDDRPTGVLTVYALAERSVATLAALRQVMPFVEAAQTLIRDTRAHEEMRRTQEQLESALLSRAVIDQAKGMIMISLKCNADDAFGHLVRMSSTRHEKVRDVAQRMVDDVLTKRSRSLANSSE
jgi:PAS domain-containing protein